MTRTMFDGITPADVPAGAALYAGYTDGKWPSYAALAAKFPGALHVTVCVTARDAAQVLDVENGDATPAQAPSWAETERSRGNPFPVIYCNQENTWPAVRQAFADQAVAEPVYWVAAYVNDPTQVPAIPAGAVALQYYDFGGYDASVVADYWPGLDPAPEGNPDVALDASDIQAVAAATVQLLLGTQLPREGAAEKGTVTPATLAEWADSGVQGTRDEIAAVGKQLASLQAAVGKLAAPTVDATQLAAALAGDTEFVAAIAAAVVAQVGADLKTSAAG